MSQLQLHVDGPRIVGEWDVNLRDARLAIGLDTQLAGEPGWQDLRRHEGALRAFLGDRLALASDSAACTIALTPDTMEWHSGQSYVRLRLLSICPSAPTRLGMHCDLLFDQDPAHRAYFSVEDARVISVGVFRSNQQFHFWAALVEFIREGPTTSCSWFT